MTRDFDSAPVETLGVQNAVGWQGEILQNAPKKVGSSAEVDLSSLFKKKEKT